MLDDLDDELGSDTSKLRYLSDIRQFYDHLSSRQGAAFNPAKAVDHADKWETETKDNAALSSDQVRRIYAATESPSEETLVLALCAWGLRRSEVAELHVSQLVLEGEDPHIAFDGTRKKGPGTVALIYGREALADRVDELGTRDQEWNGYLFPSRAAEGGHIVGDTVQARFRRLCDRAGVRVRGEQPTSKMGRRFWYTTYLESSKQLLENLDAIAAEQGSSDANVVLKNYLSETERRQYRREFMREKLAEAFEVR